MGSRTDDPSMHDEPTTAESRRTRRLPVHDFVQHPTHPDYQWCVMTDLGNAVSGICGMGRSWHERVREEAAAEVDEAPVAVRERDLNYGPTLTYCQVHEVHHDTYMLPIRTYDIEVRYVEGGRTWIKHIQLRVCDQVATQLELLPLP